MPGRCSGAKGGLDGSLRDTIWNNLASGHSLKLRSMQDGGGWPLRSNEGFLNLVVSP